MATFSTKLVCQANDGAPALGPLYLKYHFPETFYEGVCVPTVDASGFFFGVAVGPVEHILGPLYRVLVVVSGQFDRRLWPNCDSPIFAPGYGKDGIILQQ